MESTRVIRVSAVVIYNDAGHILTVRKRGTGRFIFPGGKPVPGESAVQTAIRECREEIGVELDASELRELGTFAAAAANELDHRVEATAFVAS